MQDDAKGQSPPVPGVIRFDYLKSNFHRVVHADGVVGGPNGGGTLTINFWNERAPIPQQVTHQLIHEEGSNALTLGDEIVSARVSREAIVREVEVSVTMSPQAARGLHSWLARHLETLDAINKVRLEHEKERLT